MNVDSRPWSSVRDADRPPPLVVFTHGAGADHRMFDGLEQAAHEAGFATMLWDVPGHGRSAPLDAFSVEAASAELLRLLDDQGVIDPVVLVGQSLGGNIAQFLVQHHPERCAALVAIGSTSNTLPISRLERFQLAIAGPLMRLVPTRLLIAQMVRASAESTPARRYLHETFGRIGRPGFLVVWDGLTTAIRPDPAYRAELPQLLLVGDRDRTGNIQQAQRRWAARDPDVRFSVVADAGHVAQLDQPEAVARELVDFLDEVAR